jgi:hypothetical protein
MYPLRESHSKRKLEEILSVALTTLETVLMNSWDRMTDSAACLIRELILVDGRDSMEAIQQSCQDNIDIIDSIIYY